MQPLRTCIGCQTKRPRGEMWRVASKDGGEPVFDPQRTAPGRGAWLCPQQKCLERTLARRALERGLKLKSGIPTRLKTQIEEALMTQ